MIYGHYEIKEFQKSKTFKNLIKAMQGEANAHIKYTIYASLLGNTSKELEKQILEIAHNEKEHWKVYAKLALGDEYYNDEANILDAIAGEMDESESLYPQFAEDAFEEGYDEIGNKFAQIAKIEAQHAKEFKDILDIIINPTKEEKQKQWICMNCGHIHIGLEPLEECSVCNHPKKYFMKVD